MATVLLGDCCPPSTQQVRHACADGYGFCVACTPSLHAWCLLASLVFPCISAASTATTWAPALYCYRDRPMKTSTKKCWLALQPAHWAITALPVAHSGGCSKALWETHCRGGSGPAFNLDMCPSCWPPAPDESAVVPLWPNSSVKNYSPA